nr:AP-5 complex subunit zeta-1 isoform X1 [Ipomoea trifida]
MGEGDKNKEWEFHLRSLSSGARDSNAAVKRLCELCKEEKPEELIVRVYPHLNRIFQRAVASISQSQTSCGLLLLAIIQFFIDFGDVVLHDADPSLRTFFRSCLSREFADPAVAEATLEFLNENKRKLLSSFPALLPQFFPLLLKLLAWNGEKLEKLFLRVFPGLISSGSFLPLFPSLVDLPILVVALEKVEKSSGSLVGSSIASIQQSTAPEMLLALMDEAYTGSTIGDAGADVESEDSSTIGVSDPLFLELLKDENDGLAERHWTSPAMAATLQAVINTPQSDRLKQALRITPRLLDLYFAIAIHDVNDSLLCALIPLLMVRYSTLFPDKIFSHEVIRRGYITSSEDAVILVQKRLLEFMLAAFYRSPNFVALLKKPITDRLGEAYVSHAKTELALQLCWAIGEYGGGGESHKDAARELFESLELLLYENLSSSRLGLRESAIGSGSSSFRKSSQSRLLCFVVTAIAKLATYHHELLPRARVSLAKVARSRISDVRVWRRARDYLGLMNEPAICLSVLGPCKTSSTDVQRPGTVNWSEGGKKMVAHVPFYILGEKQGPLSHDFSFTDILPDSHMVNQDKAKQPNLMNDTPMKNVPFSNVNINLFSIDSLFSSATAVATTNFSLDLRRILSYSDSHMANQDKAEQRNLMNDTPMKNVPFSNENSNNEDLSFQSLLISVSISADINKEKILKLALSASEELLQMTQEQEPLWVFDTEKSTEFLDEAEYDRRFIPLDATLDEIIKLVSGGEPIDEVLSLNEASTFKNEASKSIGIVHGSAPSIVNIFMNAEQWSGAFINIVSEATTLGVLYPGEVETHNGALQVRYCDQTKGMDGEGENNSPGPNGLAVENKNMLKLSQRMVSCYARNLIPCKENPWVPLPISDDDKEIFVRMNTNLDDVGLPRGVTITIYTSVLLPIPQITLFEFLRNGSNRSKWDLLSFGSNIKEVMKVSSSRDATSSISQLLVESPATNKAATLYLQESFSDSVGLYVVYAPVDVATAQYLSSENVAIVPSGFAIMPDKPNFMPVGLSDGGSILTICFQLVDEQLSSTDYLPPKSVLTVHRIVSKTVSLIKDALPCN